MDVGAIKGTSIQTVRTPAETSPAPTPEPLVVEPLARDSFDAENRPAQASLSDVVQRAKEAQPQPEACNPDGTPGAIGVTAGMVIGAVVGGVPGAIGGALAGRFVGALFEGDEPVCTQ